ncbi:uncharacterized protein LOC125573577 [Nematostella vectensis]|uniref:uncharacterized protein LOC125573577 n=1 Tax=Nematostella vectensis TaxID=45351 RepID=UPI002077972C|nr:uncharacterized protein LOC125573577 [Nematostella vectensis]
MARGSTSTFAFALFTFLFFGSHAAHRHNENQRGGRFSKLSGKALEGFVIATHHVTSPVWCGAQCLENTQCASYNVKNGVTCELNNETMATQTASLKTDPKADHYYNEDMEYKSCLNHMKGGATESGIYTITFSDGARGKVWCDLTSEPDSAWTMILSFAMKNRQIRAFCNDPFKLNSPRQSENPNWQDYRIELSKMQHLVAQSTHWRATTGFPVYGVDYRDYARGLLSKLDVFTDTSSCHDIEYVNVRGYSATDSAASFWHRGSYPIHIDTSKTSCGLYAPNSVSSENTFGVYCHESWNSKFRGCESDESTTQWWFGGYMD